MVDHKKPDAFEALVAEWIGEVGQLHQKIQQLPIEFEKAVGNMERDAGLIENRTQAVYEQLLVASADIQKSTDAIREAASHGVDELRAEMNDVVQQANKVADAMLTLQKAIAGESGLKSQLRKIENGYNEKLWLLDKSVTGLQNIQGSGLAQHALALSAVKTILVVIVAFMAGVGFHAFVPM